jgi:hypothetical protein
MEKIRLIDIIKAVPIKDAQLFHNEEDLVDYATIDVLHESILTPEGKEYWADILGASVISIVPGSGEAINILCGEVEADRLSQFSLAFAGQCTVEEYGKWFDEAVIDKFLDVENFNEINL